jgi:hypothetical protein
MGRAFDPSASWIPAQLKKPVKEAIEAGWIPGKDRIKAGGWFLYSPKRTEKFYIPVTCRDPDQVAKKLRSLVSKAFLSERTAFSPNYPDPDEIDELVRGVGVLSDAGATVIPGPTPIIRCRECDVEFPGWEQYASHQETCAAAPPADVQQEGVPEEGGEADTPSEGVTQDATVSTEPVHSGIIGTKEETPVASQNDTVAPKPADPAQPKRNPGTGRKQGYKWTQVNGRDNPLHEILYEAVRMTRRFKEETDSKYTRRLAEYIEDEGLLGKLPDADPDVQAAFLLGKIRELLGEGVVEGPSDEDIEKFKADIASKDEEIAALTKKNSEYADFFSAMSEMAPKEPK